MAIKSLAELRKSRGSFENLTKEIEKANQKGGSQKEDETVWSCKTDSAGNGQAVIRFLPAPKGEEFPYVRLWTHGFKGPTGKWYIENSRTTLGEKDPVSEVNNALWETKLESNKTIARNQKRKLGYWSNVLVVSDPANPENEGKVFKFRYGQKIFEMLNLKMTPPEPEFDDEEKADPVNPFCPWDGLNFKLKIVRKEGFANFDKSTFAKASPLAGSDEEIEAIWDKCHSLKDIVSADKFKSYEDLEKRLNLVLNLSGSAAPKGAAETTLDDDDESFIKKVEDDAKAKKRAAQKVEAEDPPFEVTKPAAKPSKPVAQAAADEEDDDLAYFKSLAGE